MKKCCQVLVLMIMLCGALVAQPENRQIVSQTLPDYPVVLEKLGIGGTVKLSAQVAADGSVKKTRIDGGNPMLAEIACSAVKKWKFATAAQSSSEAIQMTFDAKSSSITIK